MSSSALYRAHLVNKSDLRDHRVLEVDDFAHSVLAEGQVLLRAALHSLTYNNLTFALNGHLFGWWSAYPVPPTAQVSGDYGIVPCWGFAEVLESHTEGIAKGDVVSGLCPMGSLPFVLNLKPGTAQGLWQAQREEVLLPLNNVYESVQGGTEGKEMEIVFRPLWQAGWLLSQAVLGEAAVHPLGTGEWSKEEADLTDTVVIALSAGGKTARSFSDSLLFERGTAPRPLGFLAVSSHSDTNLYADGGEVLIKNIAYTDIGTSETGDWLGSLHPSKVVICDFGGRQDSYDNLLESLRSTLPSARVLTIGIGSAPGALSPQEAAQARQANSKYTNRYPFNTSAVKEVMCDEIGAAELLSRMNDAWKGFVLRGNLEHVQLRMAHGVGGVFDEWERLINFELEPDVAVAVRLRWESRLFY